METAIERFEPYFRDYLTRGLAGGKVCTPWNYKDDITVVGAYDLYSVTHDAFYRDAILQDTKNLLPPGDTCPHNLDSVSAGKTYMILEELTGDTCYQERLQKILAALQTHPRTPCGSFWHKDIYPDQVWLDGLYMAMPVYLQDPANADDAMQQFETVRKHLWDEKTGLYHHAWDETKKQEWADPHTGLSPCVWLRAEGWFLMALTDCYPLMPRKEQADRLATLLREALQGIMPYQDPDTRMFYQLVDLADSPGNYPETSGSAMVAYALMKGSRLGLLAKEGYNKGVEILNGIAAHELREKDGRLVLEGICASAGLGPGPDNRTDRDGSVGYYLSEAVIPDNQHGTAACMMAYSEYLAQVSCTA